MSKEGTRGIINFVPNVNFSGYVFHPETTDMMDLPISKRFTIKIEEISDDDMKINVGYATFTIINAKLYGRAAMSILASEDEKHLDVINGVCVKALDDDIAILDDIYINYEYRNKGIAKSLIHNAKRIIETTLGTNISFIAWAAKATENFSDYLERPTIQDLDKVVEIFTKMKTEHYRYHNNDFFRIK